MALLAVGLWPTVEVDFNPEKAFAFVAALAVWLFAELFPEPPHEGGQTDIESNALSAHDADLAHSIIQTVDGDFVRFLRQHDFGASWRKGSLDPAYDLEHLLSDTNSEFENPELANALESVKNSNISLVEKTALYGGPIHGSDLFDMIPTLEKNSGINSQRTEDRISETNDAADRLAEDLASFFSILRKKGLSLAKKPIDRTAAWRPL